MIGREVRRKTRRGDEEVGQFLGVSDGAIVVRLPDGRVVAWGLSGPTIRMPAEVQAQLRRR